MFFLEARLCGLQWLRAIIYHFSKEVAPTTNTDGNRDDTDGSLFHDISADRKCYSRKSVRISCKEKH